MLKVLRNIFVVVIGTVVVAISSPLLFWLGRAESARRVEEVDDDPGVDVDGAA